MKTRHVLWLMIFPCMLAAQSTQVEMMEDLVVLSYDQLDQILVNEKGFEVSRLNATEVISAYSKKGGSDSVLILTGKKNKNAGDGLIFSFFHSTSYQDFKSQLISLGYVLMDKQDDRERFRSKDHRFYVSIQKGLEESDLVNTHIQLAD